MRTSLYLDGAPSSAALVVAATGHFRLWVNGVAVARGPIRGGPGLRFATRLEIGPLLTPGDNHLAFTVAHDGHQDLAADGGHLWVEGRISTADGGILDLATGAPGWRCRRDPAWHPHPAEVSEAAIGRQEILDLTRLDPQWTIAPASEGWVEAEVADLPPPEPSPLAAPRDERVQPSWTMVALRRCTACPPAFNIDLNRPGGQWLVCPLHVEEPTALEFLVGGNARLAVACDGRVVACLEADTWRSARPVLVPLTAGSHLLAVRVEPGRWSWLFSAAGRASGLLFDGREDPSRWYRLEPLDVPWSVQGAAAPQPDAEALARAASMELSPDSAQTAAWARPLEDLPIPADGCRLPSVAAGEAVEAILDLGEHHVGFPILELESESSSIDVTVLDGEVLRHGRVPGAYHVNRYGDRLRLRAGRQAWEPVHRLRAARYLAVQVAGPAGTVTIRDLAWRQHGYAFPPTTSFAASDPLLARIRQACLRTMEGCALDGFVDCPSREQRRYLGDLCVSAHAALAATGDAGLAAFVLGLAARSQRADGRFAPGAVGGPGLVDQELDFAVVLRLLYERTADEALLRSLLPVAVRLVDGLARSRSQNGLVAALQSPTQCWIDHPVWESLAPELVNTGLNLRLVRAVGDVARLEDHLGQTNAAADHRRLADDLAAAISRHCWDPARGCYVHGLDRGVPRGRACVQYQQLALLYGVVPPERRQSCLAAAFAPDLVQIGSTYFHYHTHRLLVKLGRTADLLASLRRHWGPDVEAGLTTVPECATGREPADWSYCHAYGCTPLVDLAEGVLGVTPMAPGYAAIAIRPAVACLDWAEGAVPTPHGPVHVAWSRDSGRLRVDLDVPPGATARLQLPGRSLGLPSGRQRIEQEDPGFQS